MAFLQNRPTQTLYHYTSESGFFNIIRAKKLWFSDLAAANDPRELSLGYETFVKALDAVRKSDHSTSADNSLTHLESDLFLHRGLSQAFCCCFSLARDELPMWGTYGSNYTGLSIGFRPAAFLATPGRMQRVRYIDTNTLNDFCDLVREVAQTLSLDPNLIANRLNATSEVLGLITALKHKSWSYENEFRMILMQSLEEIADANQMSWLPDKTPVLWSKPLTRTGRVPSINYLELPFGKFHKQGFDPSRAIKEVVIGPNSKLDLSEIANVLKNEGFKDFQVVMSDCQIR